MFLSVVNETNIMKQITGSITRYSIIVCLSAISIFSNSAIVYAQTTTTVTPGKTLGGKNSNHPGWFKESFLDITEDIDEAAESNKHVMLFMHLNGCPYCYKMTEENLKNAPYTDFIKENFDVIAINIKGDREVAFDEETSLSEKELAAKLKVIYTPAVIFLDSNMQIVAKVNGYRSVEQFKYVLDYVQQGAYKQTSLTQYIADIKNNLYEFRNHPQLMNTMDLSAANNKPVAVLFESKACVDCNALHDGHLNNSEVNEVLKNFNFIRFDALSSEKMIEFNGQQTTPRDYAEQLNISYYPTLVLFDKGKEILRIENKLYHYHFIESLRYVGERHYIQYPDIVFDYMNKKTEKLLESGQDVNIGE